MWCDNDSNPGNIIWHAGIHSNSLSDHTICTPANQHVSDPSRPSKHTHACTCRVFMVLSTIYQYYHIHTYFHEALLYAVYHHIHTSSVGVPNADWRSRGSNYQPFGRFFSVLLRLKKGSPFTLIV